MAHGVDALGRRRAPALPHLAPAAVHHPEDLGQPRRPGPGRREQPLPARRRELPGAVDDADLRARDGRPRRCTSRTASSARSRPSAGPAAPPAYRRAKAIGLRAWPPSSRWGSSSPRSRSSSASSSEALTMTDTTVNAGIAHGLYTEGEPVADTKAPAGPIADKWTTRKFEAALVNPANRRKLDVIIVGTGLAGGAAAATLGEAGYNVKVVLLPGHARAARTPSPRRAASTPRRTTRRTATPPTASSTTRSRAATTAPARPTSTGWPRSARTSSTSASRRACRSPASTAACSTTARSVACRCRAPSTPAARPASSCSSAPTRRSSARSPPARSSSSPATRCSSSSSPTARRAASSPATSSPARSRPTSRMPSCSPRGGYGNVFYLSTNAMGSNVTATLARAPQGRLHGQPLLHADPPDLHPGRRATTRAS